ncbi:MAG: DUF2066 domain-containing protein [Methylococcales bacterium]
MKVWIRGLVIFLLLSEQNVYAVEVEGLYDVEVIAKSEQEKDKLAAIKQALQRVLMRTLAGDNILIDNAVRSVLANAYNYVDEYQFSLAATNDKDMRVMRVIFDQESLINTLRPGKLWLWNEVRPRTLVWLVVEQGGLQSFFDPDEMPDIDKALKQASEQKKIPILLPMQDLREKRELSTGDVLSAYSKHLLEMSVRYEVVSTLAGKIVKQDACWKAEWTLYFDGKISQWRDACSTLDNIALNSFQGIYDRLSTFYAAKHGVGNVDEMMMKILGVKKVSELMQITEYLEAMPMIKTATWVKAENGYNIYRVFYQGNMQDLNRQIAMGKILTAVNRSKRNTGEVTYQFLKN